MIGGLSMDFFVERSELLEHLRFVRSALERRATIPMLSHFLLEADGFALRIAATDLEITARTTCAAKVRTQGAAVIPGVRFFEVIRSAENSEIRCRSLENHSVQITYGRSSFKLVGLARSDYPKFPSMPEPIARVNAGLLADCVTRTSFAVSEEESRYVLSGALLKLDPDGLTMVATDGHRLALAERKVQISPVKAEFSVLIPRKALVLLPRLGQDGEGDAVVEISKDESHLYLALGPRMLASRLLTGQFPNYESVLPKENGKVVQLKSEELDDVVRRVSLLADDRLRGVRFALDKDRLEVSASSPEYGEAKECIEAQYGHEAVNIGFNAQYLLDFLRAATGATSIRMQVKDAESAVEFRPCGEEGGQNRYILMPLRF
jgi:DNA polymerase-3 subunit beta